MNERLLELAEQADIHFYQGRVPETGFEYEGAEVTVEDLKKFAELIVRQCAEVIDAQKPVWQNTDVPAEIALDMAAKNIKAYFGVK